MFRSGSPVTEMVELLTTSVSLMMSVTRCLTRVESAVVAGRVILNPLRRSVQSGVGLVFGSPAGGTNRRRVEGTVPLATSRV